MREGRRLTVLFILLGLLTSLGDYPYVDEFFPGELSANAARMGHQSSGAHHHDRLTDRVASCYSAFANVVGTAAVVVDVRPSHAPRIPADDVHPQLNSRPDRIERPPSSGKFG